jgi:UDP-N-acetylbacillosamine N-acetyltransferase
VRTAIYGSRPDGQAKIVAELAMARPDLELVGLLDDFEENRGRSFGGLAVLGTGSDLAALREAGVHALLIGFGESLGRADVIARAKEADLELPNLVHASAVVYGSASLGRGVQIFPLAHVGAEAKLADGVLVNTAASVEHDCVVDTGAVLLPGGRICGRGGVAREAPVPSSCRAPGSADGFESRATHRSARAQWSFRTWQSEKGPSSARAPWSAMTSPHTNVWSASRLGRFRTGSTAPDG